eukprot:NP_001129812.1 Insulin/EGF-Receptor L Domain protein [Caenorhabditis elegans]
MPDMDTTTSGTTINFPIFCLIFAFFDKNCYFNRTYVTSETMKSWPTNCSMVCGDLYFNANTDLTEDQLRTYFAKQNKFKGMLKFEHTQFTSLTFLSRYLQFSSAGILIAHNPKLTNISYVYGWWSGLPSIWSVYNNSKLSVDILCRRINGGHDVYIDLNAYGNLDDCGCKSIRIDQNSIHAYPNCTSIHGGPNSGLKITNVSDFTSLKPLSQLKTLNGMLEIYETDLPNISFLGNLKSLLGTPRLEFSYTQFNTTSIHDNPKLKKLGLESLKNFTPLDTKLGVYIANNHPEFCLTTSELQLFARTNVQIYGLEAKICKDLFRKDGQKTCIFKDLSMLDPMCQHIIGDVLINATNEEYVLNLKNTKVIYGLLVVKSTAKLENLDFLENLEQIVSLENSTSPIIQLSSNKLLQNVNFPKIKTPLFSPKNNHYIEIVDNKQEIIYSQMSCFKLQNLTYSVVIYNKQPCKSLPDVPETTTNTVYLPETTTTIAVDTETVTIEIAVTTTTNYNNRLNLIPIIVQIILRLL